MSHKQIRLISIERAAEERLRDPVVTLGAFDGVHRGHQAVIGAVVEWAERIGGESAVITFDRHPRSVLAKHKNWQGCITSLEHRLVLFEQAGVDCCVLLRFHRDKSEMSAEDFARKIIYERLGCRRIVLGFDCRFGRDRRGDIKMLREMTDDSGASLFEVRKVAPYTLNGEKISSTNIRAAILTGDLKQAETLLGRAYSVIGTVIRGDARGKRLGFPTANLNLHHEISPPPGVYHTEAIVLSGSRTGQRWPSITNVGTRPTFGDVTAGKRCWIEAHLLDFEGDLYGIRIELVFLERLRDEIKFGGPGELKRAIIADIERVRGENENEIPKSS